jgi:uncharacterized protein (DUF3820 family)
MSDNLTDESEMPFGAHKGKRMVDVPTGYLHWLWSNGKKNEPNDKVHKYIKENMDALKMEEPDNIWD